MTLSVDVRPDVEEPVGGVPGAPKRTVGPQADRGHTTADGIDIRLGED